MCVRENKNEYKVEPRGREKKKETRHLNTCAIDRFCAGEIMFRNAIGVTGPHDREKVVTVFREEYGHSPRRVELHIFHRYA